MRALLLLVLVLAACTTQPNAGASPTPSPTASPTATPTQTPTSSPIASPSPIALPSFAQLSAPSGTVVWALVAGTRLFRSSDRGDTWAERSLPTGLANIEVSFADDTNGLVLSGPSAAGECQTQTVTVWKTVDGAASWQQVAPAGIVDAMCKRGLASADTTHALLAAYSPNAAPVVYRTANGGATWAASQQLNDPPGFTTQGGVALIPGRPRAFGSVVLLDTADGRQQAKYVYRSTDGGATWTYVSKRSFEGAIAFVTASRWLQLIGPGYSMETTDSGASWHASASDYSQAAPTSPEVVFGDASVGYATVRGSLSRTTDGGLHWTALKTPGTG
jgi:photosystem II stability/assembly factor-like uncharacterized protein